MCSIKYCVVFIIALNIISYGQIKEKPFAAGINCGITPGLTFGVGLDYNIDNNFGVKGVLNLSGDMGVSGISGIYKLSHLGNNLPYIYITIGSMSRNNNSNNSSSSKGTFGLGLGVSYYALVNTPLFAFLEFGYVSIPSFEDVKVGLPISISVGLRYGFSLKL